MPIPTEPIGSIPRPPELIEAIASFEKGEIPKQDLDAHYDAAIKDTIRRFEATESPIVTDGEQAKASFATYPLHGMTNLATDGVTIPFEDGHTRQLPRLTSGPFRYQIFSGDYLPLAKKYARGPLKQAVISASALSLIYPQEEISDYSREQFLKDLVEQAVADLRSCLDNGAEKIQIDFTEGRLAVKLDPSKQLLQSFIDLNNQVLNHFSDNERQRIGIHTCPGGDHDSTHNADVDYNELLPSFFTVNVGNYYMQMASEENPQKALKVIGEHLRPGRRAFIGVIDVINPRVETPDEVRDRVLLAADYIPVSQLGTTDDCGFSPFGDDLSTARDTAFEKIRSRVIGTRLAGERLGIR